MKRAKLYLASQSKARVEMLRKLGISVTVLAVSVKEGVKAKQGNWEELVKNNAYKKAQAGALKVKRGIVIGADTVVVQKGRLFGKPKNLADARNMLRSLSRAPHWLYSGIAVIDVGNKTAIVEVEKTKIFMDKLDDATIRAYFKQVSPLDKAGSFDIQGKGAFFIRRIEGCFYNVVGLPLRRLYQILTRLGVHIMGLVLASFFLLNASGCSTEYNIVTGEQEQYYYSTDREVKLGKVVSEQVEKEYKLAEDPLLHKRVADIGKRIAAVCDRKEIDYSFKVLDDDEVNAVSLPGGIVYINKGLLEKVSNDDQLAGVIAHEVGHIVARHSIKKLQALQGYSFLRVLLAQASGSADVGMAADQVFLQTLLGYSREDELLADQLGVRYSRLAGFNPEGMIQFLQKLSDINRRMSARPYSYFKTHPYVPDRIRVVKQELGKKINFSDYINIEQKERQ